VLSELGLRASTHKMVRYLSQGQKRRVAMARLWLSESVLWVLDEPFVALDTASIKQLINKMQQHLLNGGCIVLTSHQEVDLHQPEPIVLEIGQ
jgi:heme exporter protein A